VGRLQALTTNITGDMSQQPIEMQIRRVENRACPPPTSQVVGWQENTGGEWQPSPDIGSGLAWQDILVVMLPGKAAEIVVVLSLEGSSRKVGHLSATASAWMMDLSRRNWRVDLWWWSGDKLEC
jgi:hypothetical protein